MTTRKDGKKHPIFLLHLPKCENSKKKNFKLTSLFKIKVSVEAHRPLRETAKCWNCQGFFHLAKYCFLPTRCVGCGLNNDLRECPTKNDDSKEPPPLPIRCNCNGRGTIEITKAEKTTQ